MGWTTTYKPKGEPVLDFLTRQGVLTWSDDNPNTYRVLASAVVKLKEFYAAVEMVNKVTGERRVWASVILLDYFNRKDSDYNCDHNFGWKCMDEDCGPYYFNCPAKILDLLTPTDNVNALSWRASCRKNIERLAALKGLKPGDKVEIYRAEYELVSRWPNGRGWYATKEQTVYRLTNSRLRNDATLVTTV